MKWAVSLLLGMALVAVACSSSPDTGVTSVPESSATTSTTSGSGPAEDPDYLNEFDPALVEQLVTLEDATGDGWTIETAIEAVELLKPVLQRGVNAYPPPINLAALTYFLGDNLDAMSDDQRAVITSGRDAPGELVSFRYQDPRREALRQALQVVADDASREFSRLTGSTLEWPIVVAISDYGALPGGLKAGTFSGTGDAYKAYGYLFASDAAYFEMEANFLAATAGGGSACVMIYGEIFTGMSAIRQASGVLHEVVHCHQQAAHPAGPRAATTSSEQWMIEGYASWAGEFQFGGTANGLGMWNPYHEGVGEVGGHATHRGAYDGIGLFSFAHDHGVDGWDNFLRWFETLLPGGLSGPAKVDSIFGDLPEDAQVVWASGSLQRGDLGTAWTYTTGPGIGFRTVNREPRQTDLIVDNERTFNLVAGEQGTYRVEPRLGDAGAALWRIEVDGPGIIRWPWGADQGVGSSASAEWCLGEECVCEDGTQVGNQAPEFTESNAALVAVTGQGSVTFSLTTVEEECEEEPITFGACPAGVWIAETESAIALMTTFYTSVGIANPMYIEGQVTMTFFDDGTYRFDYVDMTFDEMIDGVPARFVFNNGSAGTWEATATELSVEITDVDVTTVLQLEGQDALTVVAPGGTGGGTASYECDGDTLYLDRDEEVLFYPFPRVWNAAEG